MKKNSVYTLVFLPLGKKLLKAKWVYKIKRLATGAIEKFKARLVACGYLQQHGVDYNAVKADVADRRSFRLLLALAALYALTLTQIDVESAFLNGQLNEEIYIAQPPGHDDGTGRVWKLSKSIYGLKQAAREWRLSLHKTLKKAGFKACPTDPSVYVLRSGAEFVLLAVHVDDMLLASTPHTPLLDRTLQALQADYTIKVERNPTWLLQMRVTRGNDGSVCLDQQQYLEGIVARHNVVVGKAARTPTPNGDMLFLQGEHEEPVPADGVEHTAYRQIVGELAYAATQSRPDLAFIAGRLGAYVAAPKPSHIQAAMRALRYVASTTTTGLKYLPNNHGLLIEGYSDASWAGQIEGRRSVGGGVIYLAGAPVVWFSRTQRFVALSSTESELAAASVTTQEIAALTRLLHEMGFSPIATPILHIDNSAAVSVVRDGGYFPHLKHIAVRYRYVCWEQQQGRVQVEWCSTDKMCADLMTKPLNATKFSEAAARLVMPIAVPGAAPGPTSVAIENGKDHPEMPAPLQGEPTVGENRRAGKAHVPHAAQHDEFALPVVPTAATASIGITSTRWPP